MYEKDSKWMEQLVYCTLILYNYTVSIKMCHTSFTIILSNLNRFSKFAHRWIVSQISNKTYITVATASKTNMLLHYLKKLKCSILLHFFHIILCSNKGQLPNSWWWFHYILTDCLSRARFRGPFFYLNSSSTTCRRDTHSWWSNSCQSLRNWRRPSTVINTSKTPAVHQADPGRAGPMGAARIFCRGQK